MCPKNLIFLSRFNSLAKVDNSKNFSPSPKISNFKLSSFFEIFLKDLIKIF